MAAPNVFVSSTFYDLRYIRERISFFVRSLGYVPTLSEEGAVFFDPRREVADSCLAEIPNCQIFILIIGGRYGSTVPGTEQSVTNAEFNEAARLKLPVFAMVEQGTYSDFRLYQANQGRTDLDPAAITYPHTDDVRIFEFIATVQARAINNALVPFSTWGDIENYLQQQWAGMMYAFLAQQSEERRVTDMLAAIKEINERVEILSTRILASVGTEREKALATMYTLMLESQAINDLQWIHLPTAPLYVLGVCRLRRLHQGLWQGMERLGAARFQPLILGRDTRAAT